MQMFAGWLALALVATPLAARAAAQTPEPAPVTAPAGAQASGVTGAPAAAPASSAASAPQACEPEPSPGPGEARVLRRDGQVLLGRVLEWRGDELLLAPAGGAAESVHVPLKDLVGLAQAVADDADAVAPAAEEPATERAPAGHAGERAGSGNPAGPANAAASAPDLLFLATARPQDPAAGSSSAARTGDRLVGRLLGGDAYGVRFQLAGTAPFDVPFESVERVLPHATAALDRLALLAGSATDDRLWRLGKDGAPDSLAGIVQSVDGEEVVFEGALGTLHFAWADVLALVFAPDPAPEPALPGTHVVVRLRDGSRLDAGLLEWRDGRCVLATRFAARLQLPALSIVSLARRDGPVTLLADLPPVRVEQWPTFGSPQDFLFPWRRDLSVSGQLLSVGGIGRATGIGVHANARLAFLAPAGATALLVSAGLCDEVAALPAAGSVSFEVRVDGRLAAASGLLREGEPGRRLAVAGLHGGETIELLAGDGGDDDAGDRAAWVDGAFVLGRD